MEPNGTAMKFTDPEINKIFVFESFGVEVNKTNTVYSHTKPQIFAFNRCFNHQVTLIRERDELTNL